MFFIFPGQRREITRGYRNTVLMKFSPRGMTRAHSRSPRKNSFPPRGRGGHPPSCDVSARLPAVEAVVMPRFSGRIAARIKAGCNSRLEILRDPRNSLLFLQSGISPRKRLFLSASLVPANIQNDRRLSSKIRCSLQRTSRSITRRARWRKSDISRCLSEEGTGEGHDHGVGQHLPLHLPTFSRNAALAGSFYNGRGGGAPRWVP